MEVLIPAWRRSRTFFLLVMFALLPGGGLQVSAQPAASKEYQIKAAFLFNFAQFVEWPASAFTNADEPFRIGVLGEDPFGSALEETVQGEVINGRKISVEHGRRAGDLKDCQIVFVSQSEEGRVKDILSRLDTNSVLTVSDIESFAANGGIIHFYLEGNKVRFEINLGAAQHDGLKLSSQLLSVGKIVQTGKEGK